MKDEMKNKSVQKKKFNLKKGVPKKTIEKSTIDTIQSYEPYPGFFEENRKNYVEYCERFLNPEEHIRRFEKLTKIAFGPPDSTKFIPSNGDSNKPLDMKSIPRIVQQPYKPYPQFIVEAEKFINECYARSLDPERQIERLEILLCVYKTIYNELGKLKGRDYRSFKKTKLIYNESTDDVLKNQQDFDNTIDLLRIQCRKEMEKVEREISRIETKISNIHLTSSTRVFKDIKRRKKNIIRKNSFIIGKKRFVELLVRFSLDDIALIDRESARNAGRIYDNYERYGKEGFEIPASPSDRINFSDTCEWGMYRAWFDIGKKYEVIKDYGKGYSGTFPDLFLYHGEHKKSVSVSKGCDHSHPREHVIKQISEIMHKIVSEPSE